MDFINSIIASLNGVLSSPVLVSIAFVIELALRLVPSEKPKSLVLMVKGIFNACAKVFEILSAILDKVLPQNLK